MSSVLNLMEFHLLYWNFKTWTVNMAKTLQYRYKLKQSQKNKNGGQDSITEIHNWIFTLLSEIFRVEVLFSYHPSFSLPLETLFI